VAAPGDADDLEAMFHFAVEHGGPIAIRYPKAKAEAVRRHAAPVELGTAEVLQWAEHGMIVACGTMLSAAVKAAGQLESEGLDVGVINARFVKPLDRKTILRAVESPGFVLTVEEGALMGGFGSAVLETASDAGLDTGRIRRLGIPDRFIEHGSRDGLLGELGLDSEGIAQACRQMAARRRARPRSDRSRAS